MLNFDPIVCRMKEVACISTDADLARLLSITPQALNNLKRGGTITPNLVFKFLDLFTDTSLDWLIKGTHPAPEQNHHYRGIAEADLPWETAQHIGFDPSWLTRVYRVTIDDVALLVVRSSAMEPLVSYGDTVMIDRTEHSFSSDAIYLLKVNKSMLLRRVQLRANGSVLLSAFNSEYTPEEIPKAQIANIEIIGKVIWVGRKT